MLWQSKDERVIVLRGNLVYQYVTFLVGPILNTRPRIWVSCRSRSETSFTSRTRCSAGSWGHGWPCVSAATTRRPRKASSLTETGEWGSDVDWGRGGRLVDQLTFSTVLQQIKIIFVCIFSSFFLVQNKYFYRQPIQRRRKRTRPPKVAASFSNEKRRDEASPWERTIGRMSYSVRLLVHFNFSVQLN